MEELLEQLADKYGKTREEAVAILRDLVEAGDYDTPPQAETGSAEPRPAPPQAKVGGGGPRMRPLEDSTEEVENPEPREDPPTEADVEAARMARQERMRLLPEYVENFFLEDLPPIDPADPFNQGVFMRFRMNQLRQAKGKPPVDAETSPEPPADSAASSSGPSGAVAPPGAGSGGGAASTTEGAPAPPAAPPVPVEPAVA